MRHKYLLFQQMQNMLRTIIRLFLQLLPCPSKTSQFCRPEASGSELQERLHFLWSHWRWLSQATKIWWQFLHPFASGHNCRVGNIRHHRVWERCSFSSGSQQGTFWTHLLWLKTDSPFRCRPCSRGRTCRQRGPWRSSSWTRSFGALFSRCWSAWVWGLSCQQMKGTKWFSWQALCYLYYFIWVYFAEFIFIDNHSSFANFPDSLSLFAYFTFLVLPAGFANLPFLLIIGFIFSA